MAELWEKKVTLPAFHKKNTLPEVPGVYFFLGVDDEILYIGKATSLHDRVKSYFTQDISETRGPKIVLMLAKVAAISYRKTDSVLEALILEARLVKQYLPPYNTDLKDDKSYNHVVITDERFPRVLVVRGRDIEQKKFIEPVKYLFGPFPSGGALREAMKIVRKLFPYRDKCVPFEELSGAQRGKAKPCFSAQIGLCPGVCGGAVTVKTYGRTVNHIRLFFEGRKSALVKKLEREMKVAANEQEFERSGEIKRTLFGLAHIQDMALIKDDLGKYETHRIEAYDVAHLLGENSVGVMTVVQSGRPNKDAYRKFILRGEHNGNDLTALAEILRRRLRHSEWRLPEIIVVDGALLQLRAAEKTLGEAGITIALIGVVKNKKHEPERLIGSVVLIKRFEKEVLLANNEAHRFAISFHRKRRNKEFLGG